MKSPTNRTLAEVVNHWDLEPIVYICDAIGGISEIVYCLDIEKKHKDVLLKLLNNAQAKANRMEESIISKNYLLKTEGYKKCPRCMTLSKPIRDYEGLYYSCCGMSP